MKLLRDIYRRPMPWILGLLVGGTFGSCARERETLERLEVIEDTCRSRR